jgi:hypothetical protein
MSFKPTLCLDFDGVMHSYTSGWQGATTIPDPPVPGLWAFLQDACQVFEVVVYSGRSHQEGGIVAMINWLGRHAPYVSAMTASASHITWEEVGVCLTFPREKPLAIVTLDDRALCFTGEWPAIEVLRAFQPWYAVQQQGMGCSSQ